MPVRIKTVPKVRTVRKVNTVLISEPKEEKIKPRKIVPAGGSNQSGRDTSDKIYKTPLSNAQLDKIKSVVAKNNAQFAINKYQIYKYN